MFVVVEHTSYSDRYGEGLGCKVHGPYATAEDACRALDVIYKDEVSRYERAAVSERHEWNGDVMYSLNGGRHATVSLTGESATDLYVCEVGSDFEVPSSSEEAIAETGRFSVDGRLVDWN